MAVILSDMDMPKTCAECDLESEDENYYGDVMICACPLIYKGYTDNTRTEKRLDDCPLKSLDELDDILKHKSKSYFGHVRDIEMMYATYNQGITDARNTIKQFCEKGD